MQCRDECTIIQNWTRLEMIDHMAQVTQVDDKMRGCLRWFDCVLPWPSNVSVCGRWIDWKMLTAYPVCVLEGGCSFILKYYPRLAVRAC